MPGFTGQLAILAAASFSWPDVAAVSNHSALQRLDGTIGWRALPPTAHRRHAQQMEMEGRCDDVFFQDGFNRLVELSDQIGGHCCLPGLSSDACRPGPSLGTVCRMSRSPATAPPPPPGLPPGTVCPCNEQPEATRMMLDSQGTPACGNLRCSAACAEVWIPLWTRCNGLLSSLAHASDSTGAWDGDGSIAAKAARIDAELLIFADLCHIPPCADVDGDGRVDVSDLLSTLAAISTPPLSGDQTGSPADTSRDGVVNVEDLLLVLRQFGSTC